VDEATFTNLRPLLFSVAYRMLGRPGDAEDMVQETWLRYARAGGEVRDPRAWLVRVVTRLCLDEVRSARARREVTAGAWLPEPVLTGGDAAEDPLAAVERRELLSMGALLMLQRLSPAERAALVLREAIGLTHAEIARVIGVTEAASRQLLARARRRVAADPARQPGPPPEAQRRLVSALRTAFDGGDMAPLVGVLRQDVALVSDTAGELPSAPRAILGPDRILRFLTGVRSKGLAGTTMSEVEVNGEPALLVHADGEPLYVVTSVADADGRVRLTLTVGGPTKLGYVRRQRQRPGV
jgi:RNA polymerase sigma factor (sigma-70 family)